MDTGVLAGLVECCLAVWVQQDAAWQCQPTGWLSVAPRSTLGWPAAAACWQPQALARFSLMYKICKTTLSGRATLRRKDSREASHSAQHSLTWACQWQPYLLNRTLPRASPEVDFCQCCTCVDVVASVQDVITFNTQGSLNLQQAGADSKQPAEC